MLLCSYTEKSNVETRCSFIIIYSVIYGDGVFDAMRAYGRVVFRLNDHMARLMTALKAVHIRVDGGVKKRKRK